MRNYCRMQERLTLRIVLLLSVALNLLLAGFWYQALRPPAPPPQPVAVETPQTNRPVIKVAKTNLFVTVQPFAWQQIESPDYRAYIANLRAIGCPDSTIRDIIVADVNQLYAKRKSAEIVSGDHQWWRSEPDLDVLEGSFKKLDALEKERRELLTSLLGPSWESPETVATNLATGVQLTGPVLSNLTTEAKQAIYDITRRSEQRQREYQEAQQKAGKPTDPAELARLRQQTREELAKVLNPEQLEEYLLRYSYNARQLRDSITDVNLTPEQFRALFRARDALETQLQLLAGKDDPASVRQRQELEAQRETILKQSMGPEAYQVYKINKDPLFREARTLAEQAAAPADKVPFLYQIYQASEGEEQNINSDPDLTPEEKEVELVRLKQQMQKSLQELLGDAAWERYQAAKKK